MNARPDRIRFALRLERVAAELVEVLLQARELGEQRGALVRIGGLGEVALDDLEAVSGLRHRGAGGDDLGEDVASAQRVGLLREVADDDVGRPSRSSPRRGPGPP